MNSLFAARIAISAFAAIFYMVAGMQIQDDKPSAATIPFLIAIFCSISIWFIQ